MHRLDAEQMAEELSWTQLNRWSLALSYEARQMQKMSPVTSKALSSVPGKRPRFDPVMLKPMLKQRFGKANNGNSR